MRNTLIALVTLLASAVTPTLWAHHSFSSEFDTTKPITVTGVVTKVEWTNPHTWFFVDGKDETGREATWSFEGAAPSLLVRRGLGKLTLRVGDMVTIEGYRAKDASDVASSTVAQLPDGKKVRLGVVGGPSD
jgi:uncharacterized protein DUF6152